jgi:hypothetical protein
LVCSSIVPTDKPEGVAADDHETVLQWGWEKGRALQS